MRLAEVRNDVARAAARVAELGSWPEHVSAASLFERIPTEEGRGAGGFDAGIAVALGMIPENRSRLAAVLHAAYTPQAVEQVRREMLLSDEGGHTQVDPDCESVWWLAASSVCQEGLVTAEEFVGQLETFEALAADPQARLRAANRMLGDMLGSFVVKNGVPFALRDGGMQGAYLSGYKIAAQWSDAYEVFFVGTYATEGLGLDGFPWRFPADPSSSELTERLGRSGPVFGSKQFVKACDEQELAAVLSVAGKHLGVS